MSDEIRVLPDALERFSRDLAMAAGVPSDEAATLAEVMAWCDVRGHRTQGFYLLPILIKRLKLGLIRSPAAFVFEQTGTGTGTLDAGHGLGQVAGRTAMDRAIAMARGSGIAAVTVRHSNHYGAAGYYAARAAGEGMLGLSYSNSMPKVAPHGGRHRLMGTNPFAFACPRGDGPPVIIDLATGASAGSLVSHARRMGEPLPDGIALDENGDPTTDPNEVDGGGCLLPAAGAKGYCLGLLVEILSGVLTGASVAPNVGSMFRDLDRFTDCGHLCVAIDLARFMDPSEFASRAESLLAAIRAVPPREGFDEVRVPGESRARYAESYAKNGIPLAPYLLTAVTETARELGVPTPW